MRKKIEEIIKAYNLSVEAITEGVLRMEFSTRFEISIDLGSNEGYYVNITEGCEAYHLRLHDKNEALKTLGCMLILLPNN